MSNGKRLVKSPFKEKLKAAWKHLFNVNKFWGLFIVTVSATVVGGIILNNISNTPDSTTNGYDDISTNDTIPSNAIPSNMPNYATANGTAPKDIPISEEMKEILASIQKLSIGSTKDWVDDRLGPPYSENGGEITENSRVWPHTDESSIIGSVLESVYIFDVVSVIAYFDMDENSCEAFFVTLMEDISGIDIVMPEAYSFCVSGKPLGEFTFSDVWDGWEPQYIDGYTSNGVGRVFYGEQYYFAGSGNYHDFYFASLDYGLLDSLSEFDSLVSSAYFDIFEYNDSGNLSEILSKLRCDLYPNTYGISTLSPDLTFSLFGTYMGFDSVSFRKPDWS